MRTVRGQSGLVLRAFDAGSRSRSGRGFTLIEVLVTVLVTGILVAIVITGVRGVAATARDQVSAVTARNLGLAVTQFEQQFGFLPPLVDDGVPVLGPGPVKANGSAFAEFPVDRSGAAPLISAYSGRRADVFLRGYDPDSGPPFQRFAFDEAEGHGGVADGRYSKTSLAFFLVGALDAGVDGVDGPGFRSPSADGVFRTGSESSVFDALYNAGESSAATLEGEYLDAAEYRESGRGFTAPSTPDAIRNAVSRDVQVLVDRNGKAFRYYRWESGNPNAGRGVPEIASVLDLNIPSVLLDVEQAVLAEQQAGGTITADPTGGRTELRDARWAIVGAGANGLFGTEDEATLRAGIEDGGNLPLLELRKRAREDNIVEVGG